MNRNNPVKKNQNKLYNSYKKDSNSNIPLLYLSAKMDIDELSEFSSIKLNKKLGNLTTKVGNQIISPSINKIKSLRSTLEKLVNESSMVTSFTTIQLHALYSVKVTDHIWDIDDSSYYTLPNIMSKISSYLEEGSEDGSNDARMRLLFLALPIKLTKNKFLDTFKQNMLFWEGKPKKDYEDFLNKLYDNLLLNPVPTIWESKELEKIFKYLSELNHEPVTYKQWSKNLLTLNNFSEFAISYSETVLTLLKLLKYIEINLLLNFKLDDSSLDFITKLIDANEVSDEFLLDNSEILDTISYNYEEISMKFPMEIDTFIDKYSGFITEDDKKILNLIYNSLFGYDSSILSNTTDAIINKDDLLLSYNKTEEDIKAKLNSYPKILRRACMAFAGVIGLFSIPRSEQLEFIETSLLGISNYNELLLRERNLLEIVLDVPLDLEGDFDEY